MSNVPKSKRGTSEMDVVTESYKLAAYTMNKCVNENNFPKRFRWCCTSKIVDCSQNICLNIKMANEVFIKEPAADITDSELEKLRADYLLRREYQNKALSESYALLTLMQIAYTDKAHFNIADCIEYWTGLVLNVQKLIRAWRNSDDKRSKGLLK